MVHPYRKQQFIIFLFGIAALAGTYALIWAGPVSPSLQQGYYLAVVNNTTNKIVWAGSGSLCMPAAPNTHMESQCVKSITGYLCNGQQYNISQKQITCGSVASNYPGSMSGCNDTALTPAMPNQTYICTQTDLGYGLVTHIDNATSNFTLEKINNNSATITVRGWCFACEVGPSGPSPYSYNYTLKINQTAATPCATGTDLQLIEIEGNRALFLETRLKQIVCI
jgi:hypothetical protein